MTCVRISTTTFHAGRIETFADFAEHVTRLVDQAIIDKPDFLIFPEYVTAELMSFFSETDLPGRVKRLADYTDDYLQLFHELARQHGLYIIGGTHVRNVDDRLCNVAHLFSPEGEVSEQQKLHLIPLEKALLEPGRHLHIFDTEKAKICLLTCYDIEFPETARLATLRGAEIVLSPSSSVYAVEKPLLFAAVPLLPTSIPCCDSSVTRH